MTKLTRWITLMNSQTLWLAKSLCSCWPREWCASSSTSCTHTRQGRSWKLIRFQHFRSPSTSISSSLDISTPVRTVAMVEHKRLSLRWRRGIYHPQSSYQSVHLMTTTTKSILLGNYLRTSILAFSWKMIKHRNKLRKTKGMLKSEKKLSKKLSS